MKKTLFIILKAFGGMLAALALPILLIELLRLNTGFTGPDINWATVVISVVLGSLGLGLFLFSDKKLKGIEKKAEFNIVHIHGDNIMFDLIAKNYPVQALNWHDQLTAPTIGEAFKKFKGILMGGIEEKEFLLNVPDEELLAKIQEVIDSVNGQRVIIAPGCVIPINVPNDKVQVIIDYLSKKS